MLKGTVAGAAPSPEVQHLKPLDGLRGLAILLVMVRHLAASNSAAQGWAVRIAGNAFECGKFGVDLFFVLSGFLITGILIDTRDDSRFFRNFFGRRAVRILPLYYGLLLVLGLLAICLHWQWQGMLPFLLAYIPNARPYILDKLTIGPGIGLYHLWSLAIEEQFYLLWPFVVFALRGRKQAVAGATFFGALLILVLRLVLVANHTDYLWIHTSLFTRADSLLIGGLLAALYRESGAWSWVEKNSPWLGGLLLAAIFLPTVLLGEATGPLWWRLGLRYTAMAIAFALFLAWSLKPASLAGRLCLQAPLRTLGRYSYGLYVLHIVVLSLCEEPLRKLVLLWTGSKVAALAGAGTVCFLLSVVAAFLSFTYYERPFLRLKRFFQYTTVHAARRGTARS